MADERKRAAEGDEAAPVMAAEVVEEAPKPRLDMQQPRGEADSEFSAEELSHHAEEFGVQPWDVIGCMQHAGKATATTEELRAMLADFMDRPVGR